MNVSKRSLEGLDLGDSAKVLENLQPAAYIDARTVVLDCQAVTSPKK